MQTATRATTTAFEPKPVSISESEASWSASKKFAFRFAFSYLVLYIFPFPFDALSDSTKWWDAIWHGVVPWIAAHVIHLSYPITAFTAGSGDTTYNYLMLLCLAVIAAVAAVVWSVLDRRRPNYAKLYDWLRLYVRVKLACTLFVYGADKVIPAQMSPPRLTALLQSYGDITPFSQLWYFMGSSYPYEIFAGSAEMLGGILLLVPGVTTLGTLVAMGAMTNVFALNLSYDVPVKIYSGHLLLFAGFLLLPDVRRLINFFALNRTEQLSSRPPLLRRRSLSYLLWGAQWALGAYVVIAMLMGSWARVKRVAELPSKTPLYGIWQVQEFTLDGKALPPLLTDTPRWQRVIFDGPKSVSIQAMNGDFKRLEESIDETRKALSFKGSGRTADKWSADFSYSQPQPDTLVLDGQMNGQHLHTSLKKEDRKFILRTRGFHFINEHVYGG